MRARERSPRSFVVIIRTRISCVRQVGMGFFGGGKLGTEGGAKMGRRMRLLLGTLALAAAATFGLQAGSAGPLGTDPLVQVSGSSAFAGCTADNVAGQPGTNFLHSEVEPWVDVNPTNPNNVVGIWQQDRWSNGGARGLVAGVSFDAGQTWQPVVIPNISLCSGGTTANGGDFLRATDPWVS